MSIANDQNLLNAIEKMLNAKSGDYLQNNSLLGFCSRLMAAKPQARPKFQEKLGRKLSREQRFLFPALYVKQPAAFNLREKIARFRLTLLPRFLTWRNLSMAASFVIIATLALNKSNNYLSPSKLAETSGASREQKFLFPTNTFTIEKIQSQNARVLKKDQAFQLVEYTLFDGSKIIALENILL